MNKKIILLLIVGVLLIMAGIFGKNYFKEESTPDSPVITSTPEQTPAQTTTPTPEQKQSVICYDCSSKLEENTPIDNISMQNIYNFCLEKEKEVTFWENETVYKANDIESYNKFTINIPTIAGVKVKEDQDLLEKKYVYSFTIKYNENGIENYIKEIEEQGYTCTLKTN